MEKWKGAVEVMVESSVGELISIIVPVYNVDGYIDKCLDSLLKQTYRNIEIILIDDGSTDKSADICDSYKSKDNRIVVIHQKNAGVSNARNRGLKTARGQYIIFCDADDWVEDDMIEYLYGLIRISNASIASCGNWLDDGKSKMAVSCAKNSNIILESKEAIKEAHLKKRINTFVYAKLYKRNILFNLKFDENLRVAEDYIFACQAIENSDIVICGTEVKYHYMQRKSSVSNNGYTIEFEKGLRAVEKSINNYIKKYPFDKKKFQSYLILENMGVLTAMIKGNSYHQQRMKEIRNYIKKNLFSYICTNGVPIHLKLSALVISFNFGLFSFIYKRMKKFS